MHDRRKCEATGRGSATRHLIRRVGKWFSSNEIYIKQVAIVRRAAISMFQVSTTDPSTQNLSRSHLIRYTSTETIHHMKLMGLSTEDQRKS